MQLVTHVIGIDVAFGSQQLVEFQARIIELVVVIGDIHLLLAEHLPLIAVGRAVEQAVLVHHAKATGTEGGVVRHGRRATHPTHARDVLPGLRWRGHGVGEGVSKNDLTFFARRLQGRHHGVSLYTGGTVDAFLGIVPHRIDLVVHGLKRALAVGQG
ncbi:hypothetical protein D3C80_1686590 [compost metagenome]